MSERVASDPVHYPRTVGNCPPGYRLAPDLKAPASERGLDCKLMQKDASMPDCPPGTRPAASGWNIMEPSQPVTASACRRVEEAPAPSGVAEAAEALHRAAGRPNGSDMAVVSGALVVALIAALAWKRRHRQPPLSHAAIVLAAVPGCIGVGAALIGASTSLVRSPLLLGLGAAAIAGAVMIASRTR